MTNSSRAGDGLSFRLKTLHSYHQNEQNIWDIGCDHGLLGLSFKDKSGINTINLVDPSGPVIDILRDKLKDSYISIPKINIHHKEGQSLFIESSSNLIFIAGMGGKEIAEILTVLVPQLDSSSKIVISPHRKVLELRELLREMLVGLICEEAIFEDGQFYQILSLTPGTLDEKVSLYGDKLWDSETGKRYLDHQLKYFRSHRDEASRAYVEFLEQRNSLKTSLN